MNVKIRPALLEEAQLLSKLTLASKSYWDYSAEFIENCREELKVTKNKLANPLLHYYVVKSDTEIFEYYALEKLEASIFELEALFLEPKHIGKGLGKNLITHAKKIATKLGGKSLIIQGDPNAEGFYLAAGAKKIGEKESGSVAGRFLPIFKSACS